MWKDVLAYQKFACRTVIENVTLGMRL